MKCGACSREQPEGGLFCQFCGASLFAPAGGQGSGQWGAGSAAASGLCVCGRSLTPQDQFCPSCGRARVQGGAASSGGFGSADRAAGWGPQPGSPSPGGNYPSGGTYPSPGGYPPSPGYGQNYLPVPVPPAQPLYPYGQKDKVAAGVLGLLLGGFGIHKFYLRQPGLGILYLLFFWTPVPWIAGLIEGITYLTQSEQSFDAQYNYRF